MPISRRYKTIFIHIPKCGGTSIERAMGIPIHELDDEEKNREFLMHTFVHKRTRLFQVQHQTISFLLKRNLLNREERKYFRFSFVRNPWSRAVSSWRFQLKRWQTFGWYAFRQDVLQRESFEAYVDDLAARASDGSLKDCAMDREQWTFLIHPRKAEWAVDFVGSLENIEKDWPILAAKVGLDPNLEHLNSAVGGEHWKDMYSDHTRKIVGDIYAEDIRRFSYSF